MINSGPYKMEDLPQDFVEKEIKGVMAFQIEVTRIDANYKPARTGTMRITGISFPISRIESMISLMCGGGDEKRKDYTLNRIRENQRPVTDSPDFAQALVKA